MKNIHKYKDISILSRIMSFSHVHEIWNLLIRCNLAIIEANYNFVGNKLPHDEQASICSMYIESIIPSGIWLSIKYSVYTVRLRFAG